MTHPFTLGGQYRDRNKAYTVLAIAGDTMTVRFDDGTTQTVKIEAKARIWENIQADEAPPPPRRPFPDDEGLDTYPISELVREVLHTFSHPYPPDITDQVCLAIENKPAWLNRYHHLVEHFSSQGKDGKLTVNSSIGWYIKDITGMINIGEGKTAKSTLIKNYSALGYPS
ncbi:MAG: hypothetical protein V9G20_01055 [Candidatus Promineifilaceae bacterium]